MTLPIHSFTYNPTPDDIDPPFDDAAPAKMPIPPDSPHPEHTQLSTHLEDVIRAYNLRHPLGNTDKAADYEILRLSRIMMNERTIEARRTELLELLHRIDTEQLALKQLKGLLKQGLPWVSAAELDRIVEKLQIGAILDGPKVRTIDSRVVTPRIVANGLLGREAGIPVVTDDQVDPRLLNPVLNPEAMKRFREGVKNNFIAEGLTDEGFNLLLGKQTATKLFVDQPGGGETETLTKLIALALGEQVENILPAIDKLGPILDNGCPFHVARAYLNKHGKEVVDEARRKS